MQKIQRAAIFQKRLRAALEGCGQSVNAFCRNHDLDRPTITQLLIAKDSRLPRGDTLAALADALNVSSDWLLGLSDDRRKGVELIFEALAVKQVQDTPVEAQWYAWMEEAQGTHIRYVLNEGVPEMLKTPDTQIFEFAPLIGLAAAKKIAESAERKKFVTFGHENYTACCSLQQLKLFALGQGLWEGMPAKHRRAQLEFMAERLAALYPNAQYYFFDELKILSHPFAVFGKKRAVIQCSGDYLVYNRETHIHYFINLFNRYIQHAAVHPHQAADYTRGLIKLV